MNIVGAVKDHPVLTGAVVFGVGFVALNLLGAMGGGGGGNSSAVSSYFAAQSAQAQAGDALQIAQIQAQAATTQTQLNDTAATNIQDTWAAASVSQGQTQAATSIAIAPYAASAGIASAISQVAAIPPLTTTTQGQTKSGGGLFGLLGSSTNAWTKTTETANPNATSAMAELEALLQGFGNTGSLHPSS